MWKALCLYQKLIDSTYQSIQYQPKSLFQLNPKKPNPISVNFFFLPSRKRFQKVIAKAVAFCFWGFDHMGVGRMERRDGVGVEYYWEFSLNCANTASRHDCRSQFHCALKLRTQKSDCESQDLRRKLRSNDNQHDTAIANFFPFFFPKSVARQTIRHFQRFVFSFSFISIFHPFCFHFLHFFNFQQIIKKGTAP